MTNRQLAIVLAISAATIAVSPRNHTLLAEPMSPVPDETWIAMVPSAAPEEQSGRDPQCVSACTSERDRLVGAADKTLSAQGYFSKFSSNCTEDTGQPRCTALRQTCWDACGPKYDNACMARCELPFQNCCHTNAVSWAEKNYNVCVARCPAAAALTAPPVGGAVTAPGATGRGAAEAKTEYGRMLTSLNAMLAALGNRLDGMDIDRLNNLRRSLAFMQVTATLAEHNGRFAMVSGGNGRIWIIKPGGEQVLLSAAASAAMRTGYPDGTAEDARYATALKGLLAAGLSEQDAGIVMNNIALYNTSALSDRKFYTGGFTPGEVWYFPKDGNWAKEAQPNVVIGSSEHSSVRGTINGGGDFI